jgi:hypothetical protein
MENTLYGKKVLQLSTSGLRIEQHTVRTFLGSLFPSLDRFDCLKKKIHANVPCIVNKREI